MQYLFKFVSLQGKNGELLEEPENRLKKSLYVTNVQTDKVRRSQDTDVMLEFNR